MADVKTIAESLVNLTIKEANELLTVLKDEYGIEPAAAAVMAGPSGDGGGGGAAAEEQTEFTVMLTGAGPNKIATIKEVRAITGLGLKEAKELVDGAPNAVKEGIAKSEADEIKGKLETAGASVELK